MAKDRRGVRDKETPGVGYGDPTASDPGERRFDEVLVDRSAVTGWGTMTSLDFAWPYTVKYGRDGADGLCPPTCNCARWEVRAVARFSS